jgi:hypothetical protein
MCGGTPWSGQSQGGRLFSPYDATRTHPSLFKDAPVHRPIQQLASIEALPNYRLCANASAGREDADRFNNAASNLLAIAKRFYRFPGPWL